MEGVGMDELREAAKRGIKLYKESPDHVRQRDQCFLMGMFCDLWLKEHPEDDYEPVTEEWLSATFGPHLPSGPWKRYALLLASKSGLYVAWCPVCGNLAPCLCIGTSVIKENPTRGDVRRLCKALGISLV